MTFEGLRLVFAGLLAGAVLSALLTRTISALLVAVSANDPMIFGSVTLLLTVVGLLAAVLPAYPATGVEPTEALRAQ